MLKEMSHKEAQRINISFFDCGEIRHVKGECHTLQEKNEINIKKEKMPKKVYVAQDDNETSSFSDKDNARRIDNISSFK